MKNCVLILAPTGRDADLTRAVLGGAGIDSKICASMGDLLEGLEAGAGAVLTVEEALSVALGPLTQHVAAQPTWSDIPILVLTQSGANAPALSHAIDQLGKVTLLERPVRTLAMISAVRSALRARQKQFLVREGGQRKDEFLASLGHELRNPLAPIRNSMGILKHLYPDVAGVCKVRTVVERQVTHLTRLVDDLLDVARITNGKIALQPDRFALSSVIEHVLELAGGAAQAKMQKIETEVPTTRIMLRADYARLIQIIANVLLNAVKFTPANGRVSLHARVAGVDIVFSIRDSGIGIARDAFASIFELFSQEKPAAGPVTSGLGIGLNLSKRFAEMHGGRIEVESEGPGHGSQFTITLPIVESSGAPECVDLCAPSTCADVPVKRSVLVVDDNRDAANMLQALFEFEQFSVATAYDGLDAIAAVDQHVPNVIVMDLGMPGLDGYDTVRRIRAKPGASAITIVALTGWGQTDARVKSAAAGFDHHMVKPVDFDALKTLIVNTPAS
ncbi:MAG: hypothetical protein NVSMB6_05390 [Burkholderiaceae bacterium]